MQFHPQKCSVLRLTRKKSPLIHQYQLHGHILQTETDSKYLRVTVNNKLNWNNHIKNVCSKANRSLAFLVVTLKSLKHTYKRTHTQLLLTRCGILGQRKNATNLRWSRDVPLVMYSTFTASLQVPLK